MQTLVSDGPGPSSTSMAMIVLQVISALVLIFAVAGSARSAPMNTDVGGREACLALQQVDFAGVQDAPSQLTSAKTSEALGDVPAICKVEGYVSPHVGFELLLPLSNWNGRFIAVGNGGWAGSYNGGACIDHLVRRYACMTTDTGHKAAGDDGQWALNNLPAQVDFGFRAVHVATLAAKAIVARYYGAPPRESYFMGCSTGGYQGLVEAQRFPWDFDGIIAGAPDMDEADLTMRQVWSQRALFDAAGKPILDASALGLLHRAALARCDLDDGVKDGIISDPTACPFDPSVLLCQSKKSRGCLSAVQVAAARRVYDGPPHSPERPAIRGALPGSELGWAGASLDFKSSDGFFKYMIYGAGADLTSATYDFERDYKRLGLAALYTDTNPDLRRFKAAGGKLIIFQGGDDLLEMPGAAVDYYQTVERVMGGRRPTQDFFRLFMVPGMDHCGGGIGAYMIDYLSLLEAWVEDSRAPAEMIGAHVSDAYLASLQPPKWLAPLLPAALTPKQRATIAARLLRFPLPPTVPVAFTRPTYPYPLHARYAGGDPRKAASYRPSPPSRSRLRR